MRPINVERLDRLIALIDHDLAQVDAEAPQVGRAAWSHEDWKKHDARINAIVIRLQQAEGAHYKDGSEPKLSLAGVTTTCTGGQHGLLHNWQNAARRKIEQVAL